MLNLSSYKFILKEHLRSVITYYAILIAAYLLVGISFLRVSVNGQGTLGGMDMATYIFLLISGLVSFRESFLMLSQNGVSRRSFFWNRLLGTLTLAGLMAVGDKILLLLGKLFLSGNANIRMESLFEQVYLDHFKMDNPVALHALMFVFNFLFYLAIFALGFLISIGFYRSSKAGRVAIGAGIPISLFFVLPMVDGLIFNGRITMAIAKAVDFAMGITRGYPYAALITFSVGFIVISGISWLIMRKAPVKA